MLQAKTELAKMEQNGFRTRFLLLGLASLWTVATSAICNGFFVGAIRYSPVKNSLTEG